MRYVLYSTDAGVFISELCRTAELLVMCGCPIVPVEVALLIQSMTVVHTVYFFGVQILEFFVMFSSVYRLLAFSKLLRKEFNERIHFLISLWMPLHRIERILPCFDDRDEFSILPVSTCSNDFVKTMHQLVCFHLSR